MQRIIRIGTRASELALWQANKVSKMLEELAYKTEIVPIKSTGDLILDKPLYELGITGVFTRNLDVALLNKEIDIAVHSMKDVPTVLPKGVEQKAVLKRANHNDILVLKGNEEFMSTPKGTIATGSLRRKAQWLNRFPTHEIVGLRGNVNTRMNKLSESDWDGAIFAAAGLERIGKRPKGAVSLSWMLPAPAQGAIMVVGLEDDEFISEACTEINDKDTETCVQIEREFLNRLEGGCTAPIGALAYINEVEKEVNFKGVLLSQDGTKKIEVSKTVPLGRHHYLAKDCANYVINKGGKLLIMEDQGLSKEFNVFSTKSLSENQRKVLSKNIGAESSDFIKIRFNRISAKVVKEQIDHVVFTSKNAVESLLQNFTKDELNFKNIYCVGRRTKRLIEQKIGKVTHVAKNATLLADILLAELKGASVTYFSGSLSLDVLPNKLIEAGVSLTQIEAYKTMMSPDTIDESIDGVLFYSPSTVQSYLELNKGDKVAFCIGETTAKEARKHFSTVKVAKLPSVESVLVSVNQYFSSISTIVNEEVDGSNLDQDAD